MNSTNTEKCPHCKGVGRLVPAFKSFTLPCSLCRETGKILKRPREWVKAGASRRDDRLERGETLRAIAKRLNMDLNAIQNAELGMIDPSSIPT